MSGEGHDIITVNGKEMRIVLVGFVNGRTLMAETTKKSTKTKSKSKSKKTTGKGQAAQHPLMPTAAAPPQQATPMMPPMRSGGMPMQPPMMGAGQAAPPKRPGGASERISGIQGKLQNGNQVMALIKKMMAQQEAQKRMMPGQGMPPGGMPGMPPGMGQARKPSGY